MMPYNYPSDADLARRARLERDQSFRTVGRFDQSTAIRVTERLIELGYDARLRPAGKGHHYVVVDSAEYEDATWIVLGSDWRT